MQAPDDLIKLKVLIPLPNPTARCAMMNKYNSIQGRGGLWKRGIQIIQFNGWVP